jgi:23S rRNA maturation mini-RNase III
MDSFYRYYLAEKIHPLGDEVLEKALQSFEGAALKFSADAIADAEQRGNYNQHVQRVKAEMLAEVKAGRVSVKEAAQHCYEMRNKIMAEIRDRSSVQGRAVAENKKMVSRALEDLMNEKAVAIFGNRFNDLSPQQKNSIHYEIIESSARPSAKYNTTNKVLRVTGKVLIVVTIAYAAYDIANADNKTKETIKQGALIGGGIAGTMAAGAAVSTLCGAGAPICAIALMLAGGLTGGWITSTVSESLDDELEEFTKWQAG